MLGATGSVAVCFKCIDCVGDGKLTQTRLAWSSTSSRKPCRATNHYGPTENSQTCIDTYATQALFVRLRLGSLLQMLKPTRKTVLSSPIHRALTCANNRFAAVDGSAIANLKRPRCRVRRRCGRLSGFRSARISNLPVTLRPESSAARCGRATAGRGLRQDGFVCAPWQLGGEAEVRTTYNTFVSIISCASARSVGVQRKLCEGLHAAYHTLSCTNNRAL